MRHLEGQVLIGVDCPRKNGVIVSTRIARHVMRQLHSQAREAMDDTTNVEQIRDLAELEIRMLRRLGNLNELSCCGTLGDIDSKYDAFFAWIQQSLVKITRRNQLFSHFHATLQHLQERLTADGIRCEVITGRTRMQDRTVRERFRNGEFDVLLSSEVGSEGLINSIVIDW